MYPERYRSHHDAENRLAAALGLQANGRQAASDWALVEASLRQPPAPGRRGIYVHVPFCDRICSFCNLNRQERAAADLDAYVALIKQQIDYYAGFAYVTGRPYDVVYFGGGTPTVLSAAQLAEVLDYLRLRLGLAEDCEITIESTVHNLSADKARHLVNIGVNRFSIGVQTFSDRGRALLGRSLSGRQLGERLAALRRDLAVCLALDIIYDYPGQSPDELAFDAATCRDLGVDSVSFYPLMIHDASSLGKAIKAGTLDFPRDTARERRLHNAFFDSLSSGGFVLLELSKLARPGRDEYRYIRVRYDNGDLLPLGVGAGGNLGAYRIYNMAPGRTVASPIRADWQRYHAVLGHLQYGQYDVETLSALAGLKDSAVLVVLLEALAARGLLEAALVPGGPAGGRWRLTTEGVYWGNNVAVELLELLSSHETKTKELEYA